MDRRLGRGPSSSSRGSLCSSPVPSEKGRAKRSPWCSAPRSSPGLSATGCSPRKPGTAASRRDPSLADLFYASFFPLAYAAVVLMLRREITRTLPATWLDGAVAGLGAAAVCAAFAFHAIVLAMGPGASAFGVAVNLIYPIGDVLLLALVVGGTAVLPGRRLPWMLFAAACAINSVGDTFNLFATSGASTRVGDVINGVAWPSAILMISISVWVPAGRRDLLQTARVAGFVLPGVGGHRRSGDPVRRGGPAPGEPGRPRPRDRHAGRRGHPSRVVDARSAHPHRGAPPPGGDRRAHRARKPSEAQQPARCLLRRPCGPGDSRVATSRSSSSTSTTSRRSTTHSAIRLGTTCCASSAHG